MLDLYKRNSDPGILIHFDNIKKSNNKSKYNMNAIYINGVD